VLGLTEAIDNDPKIGADISAIIENRASCICFGRCEITNRTETVRSRKEVEDMLGTSLEMFGKVSAFINNSEVSLTFGNGRRITQIAA